MRKRWMIGVAGALALGVAVAVGLTTSMASAGAKIDIGDEVPNFEMTDQNGKTHNLADLKEAEKIGVLVFVSHACPWSRGAAPDISALAEEYKDKDVVWLAIHSGSPNSGTSGVELNAKAKKDWNIQYPLLVDTTSEVGRLYGAKTTPHMYVIDKDGILAYKGAIDADRYKPGSENHVANALEQLIAGESVVVKETRSYGCSVKYPRG